MKLPIQYALGFPYRIKNNFKRFCFFDHPTLTFESSDTNTFKNLTLKLTKVRKRRGNMPYFKR